MKVYAFVHIDRNAQLLESKLGSSSKDKSCNHHYKNSCDHKNTLVPGTVWKCTHQGVRDGTSQPRKPQHMRRSPWNLGILGCLVDSRVLLFGTFFHKVLRRLVRGHLFFSDAQVEQKRYGINVDSATNKTGKKCPKDEPHVERRGSHESKDGKPQFQKDDGLREMRRQTKDHIGIVGSGWRQVWDGVSLSGNASKKNRDNPAETQTGCIRRGTIWRMTDDEKQYK